MKIPVCRIAAKTLTLIFLFALATISFARAGSPPSAAMSVYAQIKTFALTGGTAQVSNLVLQRDRVTMTFNGTFYFAAPIEGRVPGAVFIGQGTFRAEVPPGDFEKNNVKRMLNADGIESDFKTAVLRFTDDTFDLIGQNRREGAASEQAQKMALDIDERILKETGANLASRLAISIANGERPGFFFGSFDGGRRGRFSYVFDPQTRMPTSYFNINAGEKGLIFSYQSTTDDNDIWTAFYSLEDYKNRYVNYSDLNDLVDIEHYKMDIDLRAPKSRLGLKATMTMTPRFPNLRAIPFFIGETLSEDRQRLRKQMRVKSVTLDGKPLETVQEDWEGGLTVFLPAPPAPGQKFDLSFEMEGDFMRQPDLVDNCHYPRSNTTWYPRHGFLDRATYDLTFFHHKNLKVASVGTRQGEEADPDNKDTIVTRYKKKHPVALVTFALGPFQRHQETIKWDKGDIPPIPVEFNSLPGSYLPIKEDFILAELNNSVRYFHALFGTYPYETFSASFHPYAFGQGFPSMLMIPGTDRSSKYTYAFISHETAHQWWGNIVAWRSYRDQWLSEGFAEYSGILYTSLRQNPKAARNLIDEMRDSLKNPPLTLTGVGKGKLVEVGPIILGLRLNTSKTDGAYGTLIYNKGALVLRMLHFLLSNPADGDDRAFFAMMKDFVERHRNETASTDDFRLVANEHFARSPIAQKYGLKDLNWFFHQYVYQTELPSYRLEYTVQNQPDGSFMLSGNVIQESATEKWLMPLPLVISLGGGKTASGTVVAYGPKTPFNIKLPMKPTKVELDPHRWVLSEKTSD